MRKKDIIIGFVIGLLISTIGVLLFTLFISLKLNLTLDQALEQGLSTKLLGKRASVGVLLNLPVFYFFLKKRKDRIAQGILMSIFIVALVFIFTLF